MIELDMDSFLSVEMMTAHKIFARFWPVHIEAKVRNYNFLEVGEGMHCTLLTYTGYSPEFDVVKPGERIPFYEVLLTEEGGRTFVEFKRTTR